MSVGFSLGLLIFSNQEFEVSSYKSEILKFLNPQKCLIGKSLSKICILGTYLHFGAVLHVLLLKVCLF